MTIPAAFLLCCVLHSAAGAPVQHKEAPPDPKRVEAVISAIDAAFKDGRSEQRIAALKESIAVPDAQVVRAVEKGLKDSDERVRSVAIDSLGRIRNPAALHALHNYYKSRRKSFKDDSTLPSELIRAIGRHGDDSSVDLIAEDLFNQPTYPAVQARIMALGNIRSPKGVGGLMEMLVKVGPRKADPYMADVRLALMHITGVDNGPASEAWTKWWQDMKHSLSIPPEEPTLPENMQREWDEYWGNAREPREKKQ